MMQESWVRFRVRVATWLHRAAWRVDPREPEERINQTDSERYW